MPNWGEILKISKSQLTTYLQCPRKYRFQYVEGRTWEFMPAALAYGKAIHQAAACFYQHFQESRTKPELDAVLLAFTSAWSGECSKLPPVKFQGDVGPVKLEEQGRALLTLFHQEIQPREIYAVEMPFCTDLVNPATGEVLEVKLVGFLDLVEKDQDGSVIVAEIKTSSKRYSEGEGENRLDGFTYAYALKRLGIVGACEPLLIRYDILIKTKTPAFQQIFYNRGPEDDRRFLRQINEVLRAIDRQAFYPNFGWWCAGCPFQTPCFFS
jgi:CRISPR/Cas system-associated exonuclease Cas4 (RecB family)